MIHAQRIKYKKRKGKSMRKKTMYPKISTGLILSLFLSSIMPGVSTTYAAIPTDNGYVESITESEEPHINEDGMIPGYAEYLKPGMSTMSLNDDSLFATTRNRAMIESDYIEAAISDDGRFTIGNLIGREDTDNDDNKILMFGHPFSRTSYTTVFIDGTPHVFSASKDLQIVDDRTAITSQEIAGVEITQKIEIVSNNDSGKEDTVKISYEAENKGDAHRTVGFRIMLDTMLGGNDGAPFKLPGIGNVTTETELVGNEIPKYWQAYDNLDNASVFAVGTLYSNISDRPDKVQFARWPGVTNDPGHYQVTEGSQITGDSAVALYWDAQTLYTNAKMSVSTSYGVGYASLDASGNQNITIENDEFGIIVTDVHGAPIENAAISVDNKVYNTDKNGIAKWKVANEINNAFIRIKKENYQEKLMIQNIKKGSVISATLNSIDSDNIITGVYAEYNNKMIDLLSEYLSFSEYKEDEDRDTSYDQKTKLKIKAEISKKVDRPSYQIVQGLNVIAEDSKPEFEFDVYNFINNASSTYREPALEGFSTGENVRLLIFSNGKKIESQELAIKVYPPKYHMEGSADFELGFDPGFTLTIPEDVPIVGNSELNVLDGENDIPLTAAFSLSDKSIKIGLNIPKDMFEEMTFNTNKRHEYYRALEKAKNGNFNDIKKFLKKRRLHYNSKLLEGSLSLVGYGEASYVSEDRFDFSLNVHVFGEINGSAIYQTIIVVVPVYVKGEAEAKLGFEGVAGARLHTSPECRLENFNWDLDLNPSVAVKPSVGAGFNGVLSVGVGGKLGIDSLYKVKTAYAELNINANLFMEAYVSPFVHYEKEFANKTWNIYSGYLRDLNNAENGSQVFATNYLGNYYVIDADDIQYYAAANDFNDVIIDSTALRGNTVKLEAGVNEDAYAFYLDNGNGSDLSNAGLMFTHIASASNADPDSSVEIEEPVRLWSLASSSNARKNDNTQEIYYDVYRDGNIAYIAVAKLNNNIEELDDPASILRASDIYYLELDIKNNNVKTVKRLTNNDTIDVNPKIYHDSNGVHVTWISIDDTDGDILSDKAKYNIHLYHESATKEFVHEDVGHITGLTIGSFANNVKAVFAADTDGSIITSDDTELFTFDGHRLERITNNNVQDAAPQAYNNGKSFMWYSDGSIMKSADLKSYDVVANKEKGVSTAFRIIEGNGKRLLAWEDTQLNFENVFIFAMNESSTGWSDPYILYAGEDYLISDLDGYIGKNGPTLLHMNTGNILEDVNAGTALVFSKNILNTNLVFDTIEYDEDDVKIGKELPIDITVSNKGNTTIKEITVYVDDEVVAVKDVNLHPGSHTTIKNIKFEVPEMEGETNFSLAVEATKTQNPYNSQDASDSVFESDMNDNFKELKLGYTDLMVESNLEVINNSDYIAVKISNYSYMDSGVNVKLLADTEDGPVLHEQEIDNISAGTTKILKFNIKDLAAGGNLDRIVTVISPRCDEIITENNKTTLYVNDMINRYNLSVIAEEGGHVDQVSGNYKVGEEIHLKATAFAGYKFAGCNCSVDGVIDNLTSAETTIYMPNQNLEIYAKFEKTNAETYKFQRQASDGGYITGATPGNYPEGVIIHLKAIAKSGYRFVRWTCDSNNVIQNIDSNEISFVMPRKDITVKAEFEKVFDTDTDDSGHGGNSRDDSSENENKPHNLITFASDLNGGTWINTSIGWQLKKSSNGEMARKQWVLVNEKWYVFDEFANMMTGWQLVNGKWYYLDQVNGHMLTGWIKLNNLWYYLDPNSGIMVTGWHNINNQWYYFNSKNGQMLTGWLCDNNLWFYLDQTIGNMLTGWQQIDGKWYYFKTTSDGKLGSMVTNTWIDNYYLNESGILTKN